MSVRPTEKSRDMTLARGAGLARSAVQQLTRGLSQFVEPTFHSRYELKYLVAETMLPAIRQYLRPFCRPDRFAALHEGYRYPICSLYLDSQDLLLHRQALHGERDRFKLRVRTYTDDPARPAYAEVKHKSNSVVHKRRAGLSREQARMLLDHRSIDLAQVSPDARANAAWFLGHMRLAAAGPLMRIKYTREAYEAEGNEPVRITLDTGLMHAVTSTGDLSHASKHFAPTPLDGVILEIKFTERYPAWVGGFVNAFELRQQSVPKYGLSIEHLMRGGQDSTLPLSGPLRLPWGA